MAHRDIPAELEGYMSWGLWVHAGDVAKEGVPALQDEIADVGKACTTSDITVLDFMEPAHTKDTSHVSDGACGMLAGGSSPPWSRSMSRTYRAALAR